MTVHQSITETEMASQLPPEISVAQAKRVLEWHSSSERFRDLVEEDPARAGEEYDLGFNPEWIRPLYDPYFALEVEKEKRPTHPVVNGYREFFNSKTRWRDQIKEECSPSDPRFKAWRQRQVARSAIESGGYDNYLIHTPVAIEITEGCSVGCWFCGVGATKPKDSWSYSERNSVLWRQILSTLRTKIGHAASWGFLYWATDVLDNPDYEKFADDFADIMGMYPQTTTAQAHQHIERVRRLLVHSRERGCRVNRFSVVSESLLRRLYESFTADEMAHVEVVAQMPGATMAKADAGAFRTLAVKNSKLIQREKDKLVRLAAKARDLAAKNGQETDSLPISVAQPGTIACVSGFLLNMVTRRMKLISPCVATDRWPLGYIVFDERTFTDGQSFERNLEEMIQTQMPLTLSAEDEVQLNPDVTYSRVDDGFQLTSKNSAVNLVRSELAGYVGDLGDMVVAGDRTAAQIALASFFQHGVPEANTLGTLEAMFRDGLLLEGQQGSSSSVLPVVTM